MTRRLKAINKQGAGKPGNADPLAGANKAQNGATQNDNVEGESNKRQ